MNRRTFVGAIVALAVPIPALALPSKQTFFCPQQMLVELGWYSGGYITWSSGSVTGQLLDPPKDVA